MTTSLLLTLLVVASGAVVVVLWRRRGRDPVATCSACRTRPVDLVWDGLLVRPVRRLALLARAGDRDVIEAYVDGAAASARGPACCCGGPRAAASGST